MKLTSAVVLYISLLLFYFVYCVSSLHGRFKRANTSNEDDEVDGNVKDRIRDVLWRTFIDVDCCLLPRSLQRCDCCPAACIPRFPNIKSCCSLPRPIQNCHCCPSACPFLYPLPPKHPPLFVPPPLLLPPPPPPPPPPPLRPPHFIPVLPPLRPLPPHCCHLPLPFIDCACCPSACALNVPPPVGSIFAPSCCHLPRSLRNCYCCPAACNTTIDCCNLPIHQQSCKCCPKRCSANIELPTTLLTNTDSVNITTVTHLITNSTICCDLPEALRDCNCCPSDCKNTTIKPPRTTKLPKTKKQPKTTKALKTTRAQRTSESEDTEFSETTETTTDNSSPSNCCHLPKELQNCKCCSLACLSTDSATSVTTFTEEPPTSQEETTTRKVSTRKQSKTKPSTRKTTKHIKTTKPPKSTKRSTSTKTTKRTTTASPTTEPVSTEPTTVLTTETTTSTQAPTTETTTDIPTTQTVITSSTTTKRTTTRESKKRTHYSKATTPAQKKTTAKKTTSSKTTTEATTSEESETTESTLTVLSTTPTTSSSCCHLPKEFRSCKCCPSDCRSSGTLTEEESCCNWPRNLQRCDCCPAACDEGLADRIGVNCCNFPPPFRNCRCCPQNCHMGNNLGYHPQSSSFQNTPLSHFPHYEHLNLVYNPLPSLFQSNPLQQVFRYEQPIIYNPDNHKGQIGNYFMSHLNNLPRSYNLFGDYGFLRGNGDDKFMQGHKACNSKLNNQPITENNNVFSQDESSAYSGKSVSPNIPIEVNYRWPNDTSISNNDTIAGKDRTLGTNLKTNKDLKTNKNSSMDNGTVENRLKEYNVNDIQPQEYPTNSFNSFNLPDEEYRLLEYFPFHYGSAQRHPAYSRIRQSYEPENYELLKEYLSRIVKACDDRMPQVIPRNLNRIFFKNNNQYLKIHDLLFHSDILPPYNTEGKETPPDYLDDSHDDWKSQYDEYNDANDLYKYYMTQKNTNDNVMGNLANTGVMTNHEEFEYKPEHAFKNLRLPISSAVVSVKPQLPVSNVNTLNDLQTVLNAQTDLKGKINFDVNPWLNLYGIDNFNLNNQGKVKLQAYANGKDVSLKQLISYLKGLQKRSFMENYENLLLLKKATPTDTERFLDVGVYNVPQINYPESPEIDEESASAEEFRNIIKSLTDVDFMSDGQVRGRRINREDSLLRSNDFYHNRFQFKRKHKPQNENKMKNLAVIDPIDHLFETLNKSAELTSSPSKIEFSDTTDKTLFFLNKTSIISALDARSKNLNPSSGNSSEATKNDAQWPIAYGTGEGKELFIPQLTNLTTITNIEDDEIASTTISSVVKTTIAEDISTETLAINKEDMFSTDPDNDISSIVIILPQYSPFSLYPPLAFPLQYCVFEMLKQLCQNLLKNQISQFHSQNNINMPWTSSYFEQFLTGNNHLLTKGSDSTVRGNRVDRNSHNANEGVLPEKDTISLREKYRTRGSDYESVDTITQKSSIYTGLYS